jgi:hypothetical protein
MTFRQFATGAALAIAGLVAAVGIGLLANSISGDSVGLGAEPLSAGGTLAPASVQQAEQRHKHRQRQRQRRGNRGGDETRTTTSGTLTNQIAPAEPGDDNGGDRISTDDNSGSGSSGSGSTPGGSGSSGSGLSGSGSSGGSGDSSHSGGSDD